MDLFIAVGYTSRQQESLFIIDTARTKEEADTAILEQIKQDEIVRGQTIKMALNK